MADTSDPAGRLIPISEAATLLGLSSRQVHRYREAGDLPAQRKRGPHGPQFMVRAQDVEDLRGRLNALDMADTSGMAGTPEQSAPESGSESGSTALSASAAPSPAVQHLVASLWEEVNKRDEIIRHQAEELGALRERERLRSTESSRRPRPFTRRLVDALRSLMQE